MDRLCDEILQLVFYELHDPTPFTLLCKRLHHFSQDPYARAHYFLNRYGPAQAVFEALGRGKVVNERVLDILMTSGAHLSRYLVQIAIHHYFFTQTHFVKSKWVRNVSFPVFLHFMQLASTRYGEIPREKGQDDGSLFLTYLRESRYPPSLRSISWETIRDILEIYKFIPFSTKDPITAQFPLVLAVEPRLLPYAVANGFYMDEKYRDFVFRKMFECSSLSDRTAETIAENVRELCRLDPSMFLSRTVAAEICMEARHNEVGYGALKLLANSSDLLFELPILVEDLIKLFLKTRSLTLSSTQVNLRYLFADFPSSDPVVRLVILLTAFLSVEREPGTLSCVPSLKAKLDPLKLGPITLTDMLDILVHPFTDRHHPVFDYMKSELETSEGHNGMDPNEIKAVVGRISARLLELDCKGKLLKKLHDGHSSVHEIVVRAIMDKQVNIADLPDSEDTDRCKSYRTSLCRDNGFFGNTSDYFWSSPGVEDPLNGENAELESGTISDVCKGSSSADTLELGPIGREALTTMINREEQLPTRSRRRTYNYHYSFYNHFEYLPSDYLSVAKWIKNDFGPKHRLTAVFMTHAVLNDNSNILRQYLHDPVTFRVPITLKHFELLARLGRAPNYNLFAAIQNGAEFFHSEEDYVDSNLDYSSRNHKNKYKSTRGSTSHPQVSVVIDRTGSIPSNADFDISTLGKKRPRRSAAENRSYLIPNSDDEVDAMEVDMPEEKANLKLVNHLQLWVKYLGDLQKAEQAKFREQKKRAGGQSNVDVVKTEFLKTLSTNLRALRKYADEKRKTSETFDAPDSDYEDDEYIYKSPRSKKRKL
ncbi:hypothetical protein J3R30DRAFT_2117499 [Lentinula aciculospora]|uniref:Uncharacterized protein n=1 Tax=Lentinula aciculospora TaxID=153920 RepID=A0A9W9AHJ8_9AGAR|nr:hypothetical protein J3R30DRAFT_2117499 [Lentinula aciculospora]